MKKTYPNDPCPCGSGKKYKHCCGMKDKDKNILTSDLHLVDFILQNLSRDITFLANALQLIIGPFGYSYCKEHSSELEREYQKDGLKEYVRLDIMKVYSTTDNSDNQKILQVRPYGGDLPLDQKDILSLLKSEHICFEGNQVELFHAYLMDNLKRRFNDYYYIPSSTAIDGQEFGSFAHRGYDFLLGITLYLELQLGVHVYSYIVNPGFPEKEKSAILHYFGVEDSEITKNMNSGLALMLSDYAELIEYISSQYSAESEVTLYHNIGAYTEEEYPDRKAIIQPGYFAPYPMDYNYIMYLRYLVPATCFNIDKLYTAALMSFPESDFVKYLFGLESVVEVFEEKNQDQKIEPLNYITVDQAKEFEDVSGLKLRTEEHIFDRKDIYHTAVFWWMDELNGMCNHIKPNDLVYQDFAEINDDDFTLKKGLRTINPARKSTRVKSIRKLRMEIYEALNGKCFTLLDSVSAGNVDDVFLVGKYPILPWLSNGKERTIHCKPFDRNARAEEDLYSGDTLTRQSYLNMEYRLTSIPVNCIRDFLNPDIFYSWEERNTLLKLNEAQNAELKLINEKLKKHIQLNQELVRSLSHSSANYLNSVKLAKTGITLQDAGPGYPTIDILHKEGLSLLLQSEQEMYLSRQLNSLVWRCSVDLEILTKQIRSSISEEEGEPVISAIEFALKVIASRILFREEDRRADFIKEKFNYNDEKWILIQSSFMLDILAEKQPKENIVLEWWKNNITGLNVTISPAWSSIKIVRNRALFDLIVEVVSEQLLNALSHGDVDSPINIELGQEKETEFHGRPRWAYILCKNMKGSAYLGGKGGGVSTLRETMLLLNSGKRGLDTLFDQDSNIFENKAWILASLIRPIK